VLPSLYDKKLSHVVECLRKARGVKQLNLAAVLSISEGEYSKKAAGLRPFTCSQLRAIGNEIGVSHLHILALTDACFDPGLSITPLSNALADLFNHIGKNDDTFKWSRKRIVDSLRGLIGDGTERQRK
jgi:hypothetical protein